MAQGKFVTYLPVSTKRQGDSGLGREAPKTAVSDYLNGGTWSMAGEFVEVETGKSDVNRPQLQRAIQAVRVYGAKLLIAEFDRLSREAGFVLGLEKAGIEFVAADMPSANRLTVGIVVMVAQEERRAIGSRTKAALAAARARGVKFGGDRGAILSTEAKGVAAVRTRAEGLASDLAPTILDLRAAGATSHRSRAAGLNEAGIAPPRGTEWSPMAVSRTLARIKA